MSTNSNAPAKVGTAPWKQAFESHIATLSSPEFTLGTVSPEGFPRVRTLIYRGIWCALPPNKHNDAPKNPAVFESDLPTFTTDVRMEKAGQIEAAGGRVEAVFWMPEPKIQWRFKGRAFVIGAGGDKDKAAKDQLRKKMRLTGQGSESDFDWNKEVTAHFGNLSPVMRGSFKNPPPGVPKTQFQATSELYQRQEVMDLEDPIARSNFRLVAIDPTEVEKLILPADKPARRISYRLAGPDGQALEDGQELAEGWIEEELWP